jgi:cell wall-associated NlpC family hydrolase
MEFVICLVPVSPMRSEAAHRSEMVNQLLFGEIAEVIGEEGLFYHVKTLYDQYKGWIQKSQFSSIEESGIHTSDKTLAAEWSNQLTLNGKPMHISFGTPLSVFNKGMVSFYNTQYQYTGKIYDPTTALFEPATIKAISEMYLNTSYLWGGRSVFGIDCSGFTQQVFRFFNKPLPRDAYQQAELGESIGFLQEVKCGDLAFFDNEEGKITHVGLLWNADTIIHASGKVRVDLIDNMGIISNETGLRTHKLRLIKRMIG